MIQFIKDCLFYNMLNKIGKKLKFVLDILVEIKEIVSKLKQI